MWCPYRLNKKNEKCRVRENAVLENFSNTVFSLTLPLQCWRFCSVREFAVLEKFSNTAFSLTLPSPTLPFTETLPSPKKSVWLGWFSSDSPLIAIILLFDFMSELYTGRRSTRNTNGILLYARYTARPQKDLRRHRPRDASGPIWYFPRNSEYYDLMYHYYGRIVYDVRSYQDAGIISCVIPINGI